MKRFDRLTAASLRRSKPGLHHDGLGLYLQITAAQGGGVNRSWLFRFDFAGRDGRLVLWTVHTVGLAEARDLARQARLKRLQGVDPIEQREQAKASKIAASFKSITLEQACNAYLAAHRDEWRNQQHRQQWP